jgi:hypothetical protein
MQQPPGDSNRTCQREGGLRCGELTKFFRFSLSRSNRGTNNSAIRQVNRPVLDIGVQERWPRVQKTQDVEIGGSTNPSPGKIEKAHLLSRNKLRTQFPADFYRKSLGHMINVQGDGRHLQNLYNQIENYFMVTMQDHEELHEEFLNKENF